MLELILFTVGRILFALLFLVSGFHKFAKIEEHQRKAEELKIPIPAKVLVRGALAFEVIGGLSILSGYLMEYGILLLLAFMVLTTIMFHRFWQQTDARIKYEERFMFLKNMAIIGALVMLYSLTRVGIENIFGTYESIFGGF